MTLARDSLSLSSADFKKDTADVVLKYIPHVTWNSYTKTAMTAAVVNIGVWSFDRRVLNTEYSRINLQTIKNNLSHLPVWDTDKFSTNLLMHPYHGSMYFNGARLNGFNFYESVPFALGGSLMWEYFMENELPSINDLISTSLGGSALGEVAFRLSDNILDDRAAGFNRFLREFTAGVLSPSRFIERVSSGKVWRRRSEKGNLGKLIPINVYLNLGYRTNYRMEDFTIRGASMTADVDYGDIFETDIERPYDWFQMRFQADMINAKPYINHVNLMGVIRNGKLLEYEKFRFHGGLFQHFNFYQSHIKLKNGDYVTPYYISEVASAGPGLPFKLKTVN
ncbi:MAG: DUF3943 domain-containing protein [Paludibacteraceae bacterium]